MTELVAEPVNQIVKGYEKQWLLPNGGMAYVPLTRPAPGLTILVHGVNDIGEAYPYQEQGLCEGLNIRLCRGKDLQPANYELPPKLTKGEKIDSDKVHPDPDKVYFARSGESTTSPVIPFYWGFREEIKNVKTAKTHGQFLDVHKNRIDKRHAKNGGVFANATTNIPDMFGRGFMRNTSVKLADKEDPIHALLDAPDRTYMVLAAQRLASLIRIIRQQSPNEVINIVAHSQGCFITLLAHAILAENGGSIKADTIIANNWPYSVDEPGLEKFQTGDQQQTAAAREETLINLINKFITQEPSTVPQFDELKKHSGFVGEEWEHDKNKERDNRGKFYLYVSPDDTTVGLASVQGIGFWGLDESMLTRLGNRFYQRLFASPDGPTDDAPMIGSPPHKVTLRFVWDWTNLITVPRQRLINAEELPVPFVPQMGNARLRYTPIDAAIATTNPYNAKDNEDVLPTETAEQAQARWLTRDHENSYHSSIVSNPMHSENAVAYDLSIGVSAILKDSDLTWIRFLRAVADWRTNWRGDNLRTYENDPSYPPPSMDLVKLLDTGIDPAEKKIIEGNYAYFRFDDPQTGTLPDFTKECTVASLAPHVKSETIRQREEFKKRNEIS